MLAAVCKSEKGEKRSKHLPRPPIRAIPPADTLTHPRTSSSVYQPFAVVRTAGTMGGSGSSLLDEGKCTYIRGKTEAIIKNFSPHYKRQYAISFCKHIQNELEQNRDPQSQFLKTKPPGGSSMVLYEGELSHFAEDLKKWKERYIVIKNNYAVESFESKEAFQKGVNSKSCILPVRGKVLTTEEEYKSFSDKHFPDLNGSNEKETTQAFVVPPKEFAVYLWLPFLRHSYYCFPDPEAQKQFSTTLNDCIRHLNHEFFKQSSFEAQAFLEAVQFFRQEKGHYGLSEMIMGNEVQILSDLVMEELLPSLQSMILPKLKGKRNERKRAWFGILEETYHLVQDQVSDGLDSLKQECKEVTLGLEGMIRSNMDQIVASKEFLTGKIKGSISEPIQICCGESIQPLLASLLEELMGPVSSGFSEVCLLFEKEVNAISQTFQATNDVASLKENVNHLMNLPYNSVKMDPCYLKVSFLLEELQDLKSRFKFYNVDLIIQRTQNLMQEILENAVYTFEQLLDLNHSNDTAKMATAIEKVKLRVLKQYDYDSSTIRKRIFQDALVYITLPTLQRTLASTCKPVLQEYEQYIFAEYNSVIQVENVYEEILFQTLLGESLKVIKEAVHLKKHNLYEEISLPSESVSSLSDLKTPLEAAQASPARIPPLNLVDTSDRGPENNEVFSIEKFPQEEGCNEPRKMVDNKEGISAESSSLAAGKEKGEIMSGLGSSEEFSLSIPNATQGAFPIPNVIETKVNENTIQQKSVSLGDVNEIRNLLTWTVELPEHDRSGNKEQDLQECKMSKPQEYGSKENKLSTGECAEGPFAPTVKVDDINIANNSWEGSSKTNEDPSGKSEELGLSETLRAEFDTMPSIWHSNEKNGSTYGQFETKPLAENGQSDQSKLDLSPPNFALKEQKSPMEQADGEEPDQSREDCSFPREDNSQTRLCIDTNSQEAEPSLLQSVLRETEASFFLTCSIETQESMLNVRSETTEPTNLPVLLEVKESEASVLASKGSENVTFDQRDDPKQASGSLLEADIEDVTKNDESLKNTEGSCLDSPSEK